LLGNTSQFLIQVESVLASAAYACICTLIIGLVINKLMGFKVSESEENIGLDQTQHGEVAYNT
jgi:Amt family ammonium transporter